MIKKYNEYLNEKLSDKLSGKTENEIFDFLKTIDNPQLMLVKAIKFKILKGIKYAIEQGARISSENIIDSIDNGDYYLASYLIEFKENVVDDEDIFKKIVKVNNTELMNDLFDAGYEIFDLTIKSVYNLVSTGKISLMKIVLEHTDMKKYGDKLFANALIYGKINMVKLLLKYNINVNSETFNPIEYACFDNKKFKSTIELLLDNGLNKDKYIDKALYFNIVRGNIEQTKYLVEIGADINSFDNEDAIYIHRIEMIKLINKLKNPE